MSKGLVCVFGANGVLGRHVIKKLAKDGWRIRAAVRRPHAAGALRVMGRVGQIQIVQANVRYRQSVKQAVTGCDAVINLAGIAYEKGRQRFNGVHVVGARNVSEAAKTASIHNMVHLSALSANTNASSKYGRSKADGERVVRDALPSCHIVRPAAMFGKMDGLFTKIAKFCAFTPIIPLAGGGHSMLKPVYVGDVAEAICRIVQPDQKIGTKGTIWALSGNQSLSIKDAAEFVLEVVDKKRLMLPIPWFVMNFIGMLGSVSAYIPLVKPWITADQLKRLRSDMMSAEEHAGLKDLGIEPETASAIMTEALIPFRKYGQFHEAATSK